MTVICQDCGEPERPVCGSCGDPIVGRAWFHHRLRVHLHDGRADCLRNVRGEDVTNHCMTPVDLTRPAGATP